jgi:hypothetical protein
MFLGDVIHTEQLDATRSLVLFKKGSVLSARIINHVGSVPTIGNEFIIAYLGTPIKVEAVGPDKVKIIYDGESIQVEIFDYLINIVKEK